jgi:hypothetical protein
MTLPQTLWVVSNGSEPEFICTDLRTAAELANMMPERVFRCASATIAGGMYDVIPITLTTETDG